MRILFLIACFLLNCTVQAWYLGEIYIESDLAPPQPFISDNYCSNNGPISFRRKAGASIPNCLLSPGPSVGSVFINVDLQSSETYQCPNKGYVCGFGPGRREDTVIVRCCRAKLVSYRERECVSYFRVRNPNNPSPTSPGFYLVGAITVPLQGGQFGFFNKECPFRRIRFPKRRRLML